MSENSLPSPNGGGEKKRQLPTNPSIEQISNGQEPEAGKSQKQEIKELEEKQTNFVFLFGDQGVGKSAMVASILNRISSDPEFHVEVVRNENSTSAATKQVLQFRDDLKSKRFPNRSSSKFTLNLDIVFYNKDGNGDKAIGLPLTFIDVSGEPLKEVSIYKKGKFPEWVDVYFKANQLSMVFLLVTTPERASEDDTIFTEFIDYISSKDPKFLDSYVCLVVTQFDRFKTYTNGLSIDKFVKDRMPHSYGKFLNKRNAFTYFSVGDVIQIPDGNGKDEPHIRSINSEFPLQVFEWIYETIKGEKLNPPSFWQKIERFLKF